MPDANEKLVFNFQKPKLDKIQKAALGYVGGFLMKASKNYNTNCWACKFNLLSEANDDEALVFNKFIEAKEFNTNIKRLKYLNSQVLQNLAKVYACAKLIIRQHPTKSNIVQQIVNLCAEKIDFHFINCEHAHKLKNELILRLVKLAVKRHCTTVNNILKGKTSRALPKNSAKIFLQAKAIYDRRRNRHRQSSF